MYYSRWHCAGNRKFTAKFVWAVTQQSPRFTLKCPGRCLVQNCNIIYIINRNYRKNIGSKQVLHFGKLDSMRRKSVQKIRSSLCKQMTKFFVLLCPHGGNVCHLFWELCILVLLIWGVLGTKPTKMIMMAQHPLIFITSCWHNDMDKRTPQFFRSLESRQPVCFSSVSFYCFLPFPML